MTNHLPALVLFALALGMLVVRLYSKEKRDFIISMVFVVAASLYIYFSLNASTLLFFLAAIILSFIGDLLMAQWIRITDHRTVDGVIAFGFAHIFYAIGFNQLNFGWFSLADDWWYILVGIILSVGLFQLIGNGEEMHVAIKISNFIYAVLIISLFMIVLAFVLNPVTPIIIKVVSFFGVVSFLISDGVLAYNEFQKPIPHAKEIIAATYIVAQILLQLVPLLSYNSI